MTSKLKRFLTDIAGYFLVLLGISLSPIPGPGGIPLILAGLGLLSVHNVWARNLREYLLKHGGKFVQILFPNNRSVQLLYDLLVVVLLMLVAVLAWTYAAVWQISLAAILFFTALFIAVMNRDLVSRLKSKKRKA